MKRFAIKATAILLILAVLSPLLFKCRCIAYTKNCSQYDNGAFRLALSSADEVFARKDDDNIRIISFNLLSDSLGFDGSPAFSRIQSVEALVFACDGDILCFQEVSRNWFCALCEALFDEYAAVEPIKTVLFSKMNVIFYKKDLFSQISSGIKQFSKGDDTRTRNAVYAVFERKSDGRKLTAVNCHLNFLKSESTDKSAEIISDQSNEIKNLTFDLFEGFGAPVVTVGDFNSRKRGSNSNFAFPYGYLSSFFADAKYTAETVFVGGKSRLNADGIDHIFTLGNATAKKYSRLSLDGSEYLSDHSAIFADIEIQ